MNSYAEFLKEDREVVKAEASAFSSNGQMKPVIDISPDFSALPKSAQVDTAQNEYACKWLDDFVQFSKRMSPRSYDGFHEAIGLWVLSTVAARRVKISFGVKHFYPSLYIALTAPTTVFAKSTAVNTGYRVMRASQLDFLLTPDDSTPQAFVNSMAGHVDSKYSVMTSEQREAESRRVAFSSKCGWFYEEFGGKLDAMMRAGGFMADFRSILRVLDDGKDEYEYVTMTRRDKVSEPYLSLLANLTPADLRPHAKRGAALWGDGFLARFAFVAPPPNSRPSKGRFPEKETAIPANLVLPLKQWHERLGSPAVAIDEVFDGGKPTGDFSVTVEMSPVDTLAISPGVLDSFYAYHDALIDISVDEAKGGDDDLSGSYGRFAEKAMRICILLASINGSHTIDEIYWSKAQTVTEGWRASLHNLKNHLTDSAPSEERQDHEKIVKILKKFADGATASQIARQTRKWSTAEVDQHCRRMAAVGSIGVVSKTKRGTAVYAVLG